jgi:hypothetical protein
MDYFKNYKSCNHYYTIYNRKCKCREYLRLVIHNGIGWIQQSYYLDDVFYNNGRRRYTWYHHGVYLHTEDRGSQDGIMQFQEEFWNAVDL